MAWFRSASKQVVVAGALVMAVVTGAGCKQGQGERCQIDDDCAGDLVCSASEHVCDTNQSGPTIDAATSDVREPDAPVGVIDGGPDAPPPPIDAAPPADAPFDAI